MLSEINGKAQDNLAEHESDERLFSTEDVDRIADKRSKKVINQLAELNAKHTALLEQQQSDEQLIAERDALQQKLATMNDQLNDPERDELEATLQAKREEVASLKAKHEAEERAVLIHKLSEEHLAVSHKQIALMTRDVPNEALPAAVSKLKETHKNLFRPSLARGVGGSTDVPKGSSGLGFVTASALASMDQATFLQLREKGLFNDKLGKPRQY